MALNNFSINTHVLQNDIKNNELWFVTDIATAPPSGQTGETGSPVRAVDHEAKKKTFNRKQIFLLKTFTLRLTANS